MTSCEAEAEKSAEVADKEALYQSLMDLVKGSVKVTSNKKITGPKSAGRDILLAAMNGVVRIVLKKGKCALPGGLGSIQLAPLQARKQRTPQGIEIDVPARWGIRWTPGTNVKARLAELKPPVQE